MPGTANTTQFLLSTATVMIGPQASAVFLNPAEHGLGLVKNVQAQVDLGFTDLTQGVQNQTVMSINTKADTKITAEVFEYTAQNLIYGACLDGNGFTSPTQTVFALASAAVGTSPDTITLTTGMGSHWAAGDYIVLQDTTTPDRTHVGKVASVASDTLTLVAEFALETTASWPASTTTAFQVQAIGIGALPTQPMFSCKIVGLLPDGSPATLVFPKVKLTKGINLSFQTNNFSNMPFEFTPYQLVAADPFYDDFGGKTWKIFKS
jgi:hypothetical protein